MSEQERDANYFEDEDYVPDDSFTVPLDLPPNLTIVQDQRSPNPILAPQPRRLLPFLVGDSWSISRPPSDSSSDSSGTRRRKMLSAQKSASVRQESTTPPMNAEYLTQSTSGLLQQYQIATKQAWDASGLEPTAIYVTGLSYSTAWSEILRAFAHHGPLHHLRLRFKPDTKIAGEAICQYTMYDHAARAVEARNNMKLMSTHITVTFLDSRICTKDFLRHSWMLVKSRWLYVWQLNDGIDRAHYELLFSQEKGHVFTRFLPSGTSALVKYRSSDEAEEAMSALEGRRVSDWLIFVELGLRI